MVSVAKATARRCRAGAIFAIAIVASSCTARMPPPAEVVTANVPVEVPVYCKVPQLTRPQLPIASLTDASSAADCVRGYAASVALLKAAVIERDSILAGCAAPASVTTPDSAIYDPNRNSSVPSP